MVFVFGHTVVVGSIILLIVTSNRAVNSETSNQFSLISGCVCSGYEVTYICTIVGGGNTIWKGSAFNCPSNSDSNNNQILLRHSGFGSETNSMGMCNNGDIVGEGIQVIGILFISELRVTVSSDVVGKQVACYYDNITSEILIGNSTIVLTSGSELSRPSNVSVIEVSTNKLVFNWKPVTHNCSAVTYIISSSSCGDCPASVNDTTATCSIQPLIPGEKRSCAFGVQAVVCDNIQGEQSELVNVTLAVPDVPVLLGVIPRYSQKNATLHSISVTFMETPMLPFSDTTSGSHFYTVIYTNSTSSICHMSNIRPDDCVAGICENTLDVTLSDCSVLDDIQVAILAGNDLGNGSTSELVSIDKINDFANIKYNQKTITCTFMDQQQRLRNTLSCKVEYVPCESALSLMKLNGTMSTRNMNDYIIPLVFETSDRLEYCYTVIASNGTYTINVDGRFFEGSVSNNNVAIIGSVIAAAVIILLLLAIMLIISIVKYGKKRYIIDEPDMEMNEMFEDAEEINVNKFKFIDVKKECEVTTLMKEQQLAYKRGCVYYQFTRKEEDISGRKIIFMKKGTRKLCKSSEAQRKYLVTDGVMTRKPNIKHHTVFVQSMGVGARQLFKGTLVLYDVELSEKENDKEDKMPDPVDQNRKFQKLYVPKVCSLIELIEEKGLKFRSGCAFCEFTHKQEDIGSDKEVILMSMNKGEKLYTGEGARQLVIGNAERGVSKPKITDMRVFVQSLHLGCRHLDAKSYVLYEEPNPDDVEFESVPEGSFIQLPVHKDCQLREFIDEHPEPDVKNYNDLTEFYFEFTSKAEFISEDKGVFLMNKESKLFTGDKAKEMIGAPNRRVNNPHLKHYRVFIQDGGAGTRFLKANSILLYKNPNSQ